MILKANPGYIRELMFLGKKAIPVSGGKHFAFDIL
jgi:hypothetical protein